MGMITEGNSATVALGVDDIITVVASVIGAEYSAGREFAAINNREDDPESYAAYQAFRQQAKALADNWLQR